MFAFLHLYSKQPEIETLCLHDRVSDSERDSQGLVLSNRSIEPTSGDCNGSQEPDHNFPQKQIGNEFTIASSACLEELRSKRRETAAGTAFFERRSRVTGSNAISDIADKRTMLFQFSPEEPLVARVQNWPWDDLLRDVGGLVVGLVLWLANFGYGAIQAAAWSDHFPTTTEKWLWRFSAVYIGFCGGFWIVLNYVAQAYRPLNEFWEKWMNGKKKTWQNILIGIPVVICGASLLFARAFLVIEAFISVRELPASAYVTPTWS
ncbi:MAG: hypothetical protein Q9170_004162 [Blastenia crenularia]